MSDRKTAVVLGVGPGLGMSIAQRFGKEGYAVAVVSRSADRHAGYVGELAANGIEAAAFVADVNDPAQLRSALDAIDDRFGGIDVVYFGPAGTGGFPKDLTTITVDDVRVAMDIVYPAVDTVSVVLPRMLERGAGALLFGGGISGQIPMPMLGQLVLPSAALRQYVLTLHEVLAPKGVYAGILTIGGVVERGDIHTMISGAPERFGNLAGHTLNPDEIADEAWALFTDRKGAEATFSAL
ncbi:SDR family NAD(P)-dependent oxidoreductase [Pseudonocardia sp. TRM90224]|uniref:SDR family NAD(P)-dependent oxidoreductase n=1 Tax=Pseudonocardia sp. TRM90224 TaxID=2812678 RepID=UPI001E3FE61D|nr:SDR family NAD(P)-dependent oxidoreductase [Pseudonocardia sp. TRM90224]